MLMMAAQLVTLPSFTQAAAGGGRRRRRQAAAAPRKRATLSDPIAAHLLHSLSFASANMSASSDQVGVGLYLVPVEQRGFQIKGTIAYYHIVLLRPSSVMQALSLVALQSALVKSVSTMCWWRLRAET
jgi:hypothetical protein